MFTFTEIQTLTGMLPFLWTACIYVLALYLLTEASPLHVHHIDNILNHHARGQFHWRSH